jgi:hypothetical protein
LALKRVVARGLPTVRCNGGDKYVDARLWHKYPGSPERLRRVVEGVELCHRFGRLWWQVCVLRVAMNWRKWIGSATNAVSR